MQVATPVIRTLVATDENRPMPMGRSKLSVGPANINQVAIIQPASHHGTHSRRGYCPSQCVTTGNPVTAYGFDLLYLTHKL